MSLLLLFSTPPADHALTSHDVVVPQYLTLGVAWEVPGLGVETSSAAASTTNDVALLANDAEASAGAATIQLDSPLSSNQPTAWNYSTLAVRWRRSGSATAEASSGVAALSVDTALSSVSWSNFLTLGLSWDTADLTEESAGSAQASIDNAFAGAEITETSAGSAAVDLVYDARPLVATETLLKSASSDLVDVGDSRRTRIQWKDRELGYAVAPPRVKLFIRNPLGQETMLELGVDPEILADTMNSQVADLHFNRRGLWRRRWVAYDDSGNPIEADERAIRVRPSPFVTTY